MNRIGRLVRRSDGAVILEQVRWCASFFCRLRGLMFRQALDEQEGLLLVEPVASRAGAAIHMLFMRFPIAAIWLDSSFCVVDKVLARRWRLLYMPAEHARYTLEARPEILATVEIGDELSYEEYH